MKELIGKYCIYRPHEYQFVFCKVIASNPNEGTLLKMLYIKAFDKDQWSNWEPYDNVYNDLLIETKELYGTQFTHYSKPQELLEKETNNLTK